MFKVFESNLYDMDRAKVVAEFHTQWEADEYIGENEERSKGFGYSLFIEEGQEHVDAKNFVETIRKNINNKHLTDEDFRTFIRNTLPVVEK